jgi:RNA polymerase sigma-70 factor, ECF subfamily
LASPDQRRSALTIEDVWRELGGSVRGFVHRRVADRDAVDDIVAEVMLRAHANLGGLDDHDKVTAWVYRIARNAITDHYRSVARRVDVPMGRVADSPGVDVGADGWLDGQAAPGCEPSGALRPLVQQLPPDYRRAIELTDLGGMTQADAARLEQLSVSGMKSRVQRGRRQLAALLHQRCEVSLDATGMPTDCAPRADGCGCDG